ncbi:mercury transporter [Streptomyces griseoincarnatus]
MSASRERSGLGGIAAVVGAGLLMVVCCAGPLLVAGGALGAVGGALASPWLITVGAVVVLAGIGYGLRCRARRRRGAGPEDCCPTVPAEPQPHEEVDEVDPGGDVR